jgi:zinc protease
VFSQIEKLKTKGVTAEEIAKVKETERREWETNVKRNEYWVGQLAARDEAREPLAGVLAFPARLAAITPQQIQQASLLLRKENYVRVSLLPEK